MTASLAGLVLAAALAAASPAAAPRVPESCSSDTFSIDGHSVGVQVCAPSDPPRSEKGKRDSIVLRETISSGGTSFVRTTSLEYLDTAETSRTIDDVPLDKLGIAKTLHLTIGYKPGAVRLEHALLVPGAVPLK